MGGSKWLKFVFPLAIPLKRQKGNTAIGTAIETAIETAFETAIETALGWTAKRGPSAWTFRVDLSRGPFVWTFRVDLSRDLNKALRALTNTVARVYPFSVWVARPHSSYPLVGR